MTDFCETCGKKLDKKKGQTRFCSYDCYWKSLKNKRPHNYNKFKYDFLGTDARNNKVYQSWTSMLIRCNNKDARSYKNYGGRGIKVCDEWQEFEPFYNWAINNGYQEGLTIERVDVNSNYCPENCKWIPPKEQAKNKRNNVIVFYNNKKMILKEVAEMESVDYKGLWQLYKKQNKDIYEAVKIAKLHKQGLWETNTFGFRGVTFQYNAWVVTYKNKYVCRCKTFEEAVQIRLNAEKQDKKE